MDKDNVIDLLQKAKKAHIQWVIRAQALTEGLPVQKEAIPMDCTECVFGLWLYSDGQDIRKMPGMDIMKDIEAKHYDLHAVYLKIFSTYFPESKKGLFAKIFASKPKITEEQQSQAKEEFLVLKEISNELTQMLSRLERLLTAIR
jgi:hypothetical protein